MKNDTVFTGAVPELYNRYLGPILFQPYADAVAEQLTPADRSILETAAGTGIVTRAMAAAQPHATIVATDLNQGMLDVAAAMTKARNVTWDKTDAQALPYPAGAYDTVVCCFGVMFMSDKQAAFSEARRVLRPQGRFLFTVWDRIETNLLMHIAEETVATIFPDNPARFFSRTPCGYNDRGEIERALRKAGFTTVKIEDVRRESDVASAKDAAIGLCQGTPLRNEIEARNPQGLVQATEAAAAALQSRFSSGAFRAPLQALLVTAG